MKEHELYDKLSITKDHRELRPISNVLNLLVFSYLTLLGKYDELLETSSNYSMSALTSSILCEDFRTMSYIAKSDIESAKVQVKYALTVDPEDFYSYLFEGIIKKLESENGDISLSKAIALASPREKKAIKDFVKTEEDSTISYLLNRTGETSERINRVQKIIKENPSSPIAKLSLAETSLEKGEVENALRIVSSLVSLYPSYPRALRILYKIYSEFLKNDAAANHYADKLFSVNPISFYTPIDKTSSSESEEAEVSELEKIFIYDNPLLGFIKNKLRNIEENGVQGNNPLKKSTDYRGLKEKIKAKAEEEPEKNIRETKSTGEATDETTDYIECGFNALSKKDYAEAITYFLKSLKENQ